MTPILIVNGPAGSGKDTIAQMIVDKVGGQCIAQADPMKRLAMNTFRFNELQLWGPSEERNKPDPRFAPGSTSWDDAIAQIEYGDLAEEWLYDLGIEGRLGLLVEWAHGLKDDFAKTNRVLTPRAALQTLGTEFGRMINRNVWVDHATKTAKRLLEGQVTYNKTYGLRLSDDPGQKLVVITDGRFRNEILNVSMLGGKALKISPPSARTLDAAAVDVAGIKGHASEAEQNSIPDFWYNTIYVNDKSLGLEQLRFNVANVILPSLGIY